MSVTYVVESSLSGNGGAHNVLRMTSEGKEYMVSFFSMSGQDIAPIVTARIAALETALAESEADQMLEQ